MMYGAEVAVYTGINTKHINTNCEQKVQLLNVKPVGASRKH
jgi:hypothetical protein